VTLENTKIRFRPGFCPHPAGEAHAADPDPLIGWEGNSFRLIGSAPRILFATPNLAPSRAF